MCMPRVAFDPDQSLSYSISLHIGTVLTTWFMLFSGDLTVCAAAELLHTNSYLARPWVTI